MDRLNIIQNVHQRIQQQKSQPTLSTEATLVPCTCCLTATVADDGPDEAPSSTRCAAACSWRFPRNGSARLCSALLCGRDRSHAKLHTSRKGKKFKDSFQHLGLKEGGGEGVAKTSI